MDFDKLCMGCMADRGENELCPVCGWKEGTVPDAPQCLSPRTVLNGQYLVGRALGRGGFGITYLAWDLNLGIKLAIKEYLPDGFATRLPGSDMVSVYSGDMSSQYSYGLEKFLDEAKAVAQFNGHPNIVAVRNFFRENGTAYFVMDYIEGVTFKKQIEEKGGRIPFEDALRIMLQVMEALKEVHGKGLLHRDISPDNIYIAKNGQVKILDFGAARSAIGEQSKSISVILKPGYAPEEQYRSKGKQGTWTDVYAVGATLYRAITGSVPSESLDRMEHDELQPPSRLGIQIPPQVEAALMKALAVRAQDRLQTMEEFQNALRGIMQKPSQAGGSPVSISDPAEITEVECYFCNAKNRVPKHRLTTTTLNAYCLKCGNSLKSRPQGNNPANGSLPNSHRPGPAIGQQGNHAQSGRPLQPVMPQNIQPNIRQDVNSHQSFNPNMMANMSNPLPARPVPVNMQTGAQMQGQYLANPPIMNGIMYAGFWRRFAACFIDGLLLGIVYAISNAIAYALDDDAVVVAMFLNIVVAVLYYGIMESSSHRATLGKMALGMVVTDMGGKQITFGRALGRYGGKIISSMIFCIGHMMAGFTEKKQALHDIMAGSLVIMKNNSPSMANRSF